MMEIGPDELGVLGTTWPVVRVARHVHLDHTAIARVATELAGRSGAFERPAWNTHYHYAGRPADTAHYILVLDTLNFCFWGEPRWRIAFQGEVLDGYWALAAALKQALETDRRTLEPAALATIDRSTLGRLLAGQGEIPLLDERVAGLRELGTVLCDRWEGQTTRLIAAAQGSAPGLARLVAAELSSFNDVTSYAGQPVRLLKRAQIVVGDLAGALGGQGLGALHGLEQLTAFADYKVPQVLRRLGILTYDDHLATLVDQRIELAAGSPEEVEIRAATIWGVEQLRRAMTERGRPVAAYEVDWYLWELGQRSRDDLPYHRTRTIFY